MKQIALTFAILLTFGMTTAFAQETGGGMFEKGPTRGEEPRGGDATPMIPKLGQTNDQASPLEGGLLLIGFGAAYALLHKRKKD